MRTLHTKKLIDFSKVTQLIEQQSQASLKPNLLIPNPISF